MPGPDITADLRTIARNRSAIAREEQALEALLVSRAGLAARRDSLLAAGDVSRAAEVERRIERAEAEAESRRVGRDHLVGEVTDLSDGLFTRFTPEVLTATLDGVHPVAMLPVRIETRYDGPTRLRVRLFPDQVHIDAHDPAFTTDEAAAAQWYWEQRWAAGLDDADAAGLAWRGLVEKFRPGRAAYLVEALTPTNTPADGAPAFPSVPTRASSWSRPPVATALPDRFCVVGLARQGGQWVERFRKWADVAVKDRLPVGPDPRTMSGAAQPGDLPADVGSLWLRDPEAARREGVLITIEDRALASGVERLVVLGVDWTQTPDQAAAMLASLLEAQQHAGHLGFVRQGTPTNNTSDGRSGHTSAAAVEAAALDPARTVDIGDEWSAGTRLARALGLPDGTLAGLPGADAREHAWSSALTDALWCATAGSYLADMLDPLVDDHPLVDGDLREFTRQHVFASGPLPTLRVGAQPYGVLPVVAPRSYQPGGGATGLVRRVAGVLRDVVTPAIDQVPHLRRAGEDQDVDTVLLQLLQRTPVPWTFRFRSITGPFARKNIGVYWDLRNAVQRTWTTAIWSGLGVNRSVRLMELTLGKDHPLRVPLVVKPGAAAPTSYLEEIAALTHDPHGRLALNLREDSLALLEALVACSAVEELDRCGLRSIRDAVSIPAATLAQLPALAKLAIPSPESHRVEPAPTVPRQALDFRSGRELAGAVVPEVSATLPVGEFVTAHFADLLVGAPELLRKPASPWYWLAQHREALLGLAEAPVDELEWAFRGYLDLFSTRLDAWFTGLATERLAEHRSAAATGVHLGCWGFVEGLGQDSGAAAESLGFVHTPSLMHAASTALLRNGRLANRGDDGAVFDLQVTSERVRRAQWLLDGVGQGQRLAALLGYRLERGLRDKRLTLMRYQMPMRRVAPLRGPDVTPGESVEVLAARDVVDGVALLDRWREQPATVLADIRAQAGMTSFPGTDEADLRAVIDDVFDSYDAVSDLLVAESVHQAVLGNLERSGAALSAHDRHGRAPELDYVASPRSGHTIAHRVAVTLQDPALRDGWKRDARGAAEPLLDAWIGRLLGRPADWSFGGMLTKGTTSTVLTPVDAGGLGLGPLSLLLATQRAGEDQPTELHQRIALALAAQAPPDPDTTLELTGEALALLETLAAWATPLFKGSALTAGDFQSGQDVGAGLASPGTVDVAELASRVSVARAALAVATNRLVAATTTSQRSKALLDAVAFDGPDALPVVPANHPDAASALAEQATAVAARLVARQAEVAASVARPLPVESLADPVLRAQAEVARHVEVLHLLLGAAQPVLPRWTLADPAPVEASLADRARLVGEDPTLPASWLQRYALVRPELEGFAGLMLHAEADGDDVVDQLAVVQLPHRPGTSWIARPLDRAGNPGEEKPVPPPQGTVGLVLHSWKPFNPRRAFAGVLVDGWSETIPADTETTAVTFHYDAPGARAPQSILLAVHPERRPGSWTFELLLDTVNEAADLARLRMLSAAELAPLGSFLPALYLPDDYTHDVPSVSLADLVTRADVMLPHADVLGKA